VITNQHAQVSTSTAVIDGLIRDGKQQGKTVMGRTIRAPAPAFASSMVFGYVDAACSGRGWRREEP